VTPFPRTSGFPSEIPLYLPSPHRMMWFPLISSEFCSSSETSLSFPFSQFGSPLSLSQPPERRVGLFPSSPLLPPRSGRSWTFPSPSNIRRSFPSYPVFQFFQVVRMIESLYTDSPFPSHSIDILVHSPTLRPPYVSCNSFYLSRVRDNSHFFPRSLLLSLFVYLVLEGFLSL